jgi:predicted pyridoxine 5'-phosphate oxidase superfamily flavin-nucleotide-binding protein
MTEFYDPGHRALQQEFASESLADRLEAVIVHDFLDKRAVGFIEQRDFFFLSSVDQQGFPTVSYKGGGPGFVQVTDTRTLLFPCFDGNGMWLSAGNIDAQSKVGLLFIDFEQPNRLRVQGQARLCRDPAVLELWPEVGLAVEVAIARVWVNCPRYIHQMTRVEDAPHVPKPGVSTPVPEWKSMDALADVVPPAPHRVKDD